MSTVAAVKEGYGHTASELALATVGGGSARAVAAANAILAEFAEEKGLGAQRNVAVNDNQAKDTAAMFAASIGAAGLNFANVDSGYKAPASAPAVSDNSVGTSR